ncbi:MAG TPA: glutathione S-transferase family protein [Kofleriaceae bacterium]|nr:glutathione S-transferase family protein [Kofleriaceae bacterium]
MDLYFSPRCGNSKRVLFAIEELGLDVERRPIDLRRGEHKTPAYLAMNPAGKVPLLVDGELLLWESNAILLYLAEQRPDRGLLPEGANARAEVYKWLFFLAYEIAKPAFQYFFHQARIGPTVDAHDLEAAGKSLQAAMPVIEQQLTNRSFLLDAFSLADVAYAPSMSILKIAGFDLAAWPHLAAWSDALLARPAWQTISAAA